MGKKIQEVLDCAIDRVNELLPDDAGLSKDKATLLLGQGGRLDSMGFVNLLVALEEELNARFGIEASMADELMATQGVLSVGDLFEIVSRVVGASQTAGGMASSDVPRQ